MKIKGKTISGANEEFVIIPRGSSEDIIFKVKAILDMDPFDKLCPPPEPPKRMYAGGQEVVNIKDPAFLEQVTSHSVKRLNWIVLTSLEATDGLEWDNIDMGDPSTWDNFKEELKESGFSGIEIQRIVAGCIEVNALDESKIEEARERFLLEAQGLKDE